MIVVLNGEGPTDLGVCDNGLGTCRDEAFEQGPMTIVIDQIISSVLNYSLLDYPGSYHYVSRGYLSEWCKNKDNRGRLWPTRGKYSPSEVSGYRLHAFALAEIAKEIQFEEGRPTIPVMFRDADGTNTSALSQWKDKYEAMCSGFGLASFRERSVPMLPMPKSEAWLICAAKERPYQDCVQLEALSGNDASPQSAKAKLAELRKREDTAVSLREWLKEQPFDCERGCQMPSFASFRKDLFSAINAAIK